MKRDMDLVRLILMKVEEDYESTALNNLEIEGYSKNTIAYHCKILYEAGLLSLYSPVYAGNKLLFFSVGSLTWEGCDYLEKIRDNSTWKKVKKIMHDEALPVTIDILKSVASALITTKVKSVIDSRLF